jgi:hypothetical protein
MKARIIRSWACAPEGHTIIRYDAGENVEGKVAELALADGAAVEINVMPALETKIEQPLEVKRPRGRFRKEASE